MKDKIEEMFYWADMTWFNFRNATLNGLARWCMGHCCIDFSTTTMAMHQMTDLELRDTTDRVISWRKRHPDENYWEII